MKPRITITIFLLLVGVIVAFLPKVDNKSYESGPEELLVEIQKSNNHFSVDEIAKLLIAEDPEILLIDVRSKEEYEKFSLPGSINIPFEQLLNEEWEAYIDQEDRKNIFYSNGSIISSQAWALTQRKGYTNNFILTGGVNDWFERIVMPVTPDMTQDLNEIENYELRKATRAYFYGGSVSSEASSSKPVLTVKRKKRKTAEGGCS